MTDLQKELDAARGEITRLKEEVLQLRATVKKMANDSESAGERSSNQLLKQVRDLLKEKEDSVAATEVEGKLIISKLVKKIEALQRERVTTEATFQVEEEGITNRLSGRIGLLEKEKLRLEDIIEEKNRAIRLLAQRYSAKLGRQPSLKELQPHLADAASGEREEGSPGRKELAAEVEKLRAELRKYKKNNTDLRVYNQKMREEKFFLMQRMRRQMERFHEMESKKALMEASLEVEMERAFNNMTRGGLPAGVIARARSESVPDRGRFLSENAGREMQGGGVGPGKPLGMADEPRPGAGLMGRGFPSPAHGPVNGPSPVHGPMNGPGGGMGGSGLRLPPPAPGSTRGIPIIGRDRHHLPGSALGPGGWQSADYSLLSQSAPGGPNPWLHAAAGTSLGGIDSGAPGAAHALVNGPDHAVSRGGPPMLMPTLTPSPRNERSPLHPASSPLRSSSSDKLEVARVEFSPLDGSR